MPDPATADLIDRLRRHYEEGCFACGRENPIGLHMDDFDFVDGQVSARFDPREHYRGAGTTLHGGVAATALDEILVWAGILTEKVMTVTARLELRYRRETKVGDRVAVRSRVDERRGRRLLCSGELTVDGEVRVEASGLFLVSADLVEMGLV